MSSFLLLFLILITPGLSILDSDETGLTILYSPTTITFGDYVHVEGAAYPDESGVPCIPEIYVYIAIPPGCEVKFDVRESTLKETRMMDIAPVPEVHEWGYEYKRNPSIYEKDILYPPEIVSIKERGFIRSQEFILLKLQPVRYNPKKGMVKIYEHLIINVHFIGGKPGQIVEEPLFEHIFREFFINYENSKNWRKKPERKMGKYNNNTWLKIELDEAGIYKINYDDLRKAGLDPDFINPLSFRLFTQGGSMEIPADDTLKEVPIYIKDDDIYFYATSTDGYDKNGISYASHSDTVYLFPNIFTDINVYWLTYGGLGRRDSISGNLGSAIPFISQDFKDTIHFEEDYICPAKSGRGWAWFELKRTILSPTSYNLSFELPKLGGSTADGRFGIYGYTKDRNGLNMYHDVKLYINGEEIIEDTWRGGHSLNPYLILTEVSNLNDGQNELMVELWPGPDADTLDWIYFDNFELIPTLTYEQYNGMLHFQADEGDTIEFHLNGFDKTPIIFNIDDELLPIRITDITYQDGEVIFQSTSKGPYYAATTFKSPKSLTIIDPFNLINIDTQNFDYIIITKDDFKYIAQELARYREEKDSITTKVVLIDNIYDNFSFGLKNPYGIRNFLKFAYENWNTYYILLLGSGTYDYRSEIEKNIIPPWEEGYRLGEFGLSPHENPCYDNWFAMVSGDDNMPDMVISRITAESRDDSRQAVEKILDYEASFGPWRSRILLSADDEYGAKKQGEQTHTEHCEYLSSITPSSYNIFKLYLINYPPDEQGTKGNIDMIKNLNKGVYYGVFMGHGNYKQLAHENIWTSPKDVYALSNNEKYSIFFYGSCGVGAFDRPYTRCTADLMQIVDERGSIATIAATRSTYPADNTSMSTPLYNHIVVAPEKSVGEAFFLSFSTGNPKKYILFGDPLTNISRYVNSHIYTSTDSLWGGMHLEVTGESEDVDTGYVYITLYGAENKWIYNWSTHQRRVWDGPPATNEIEYTQLGDIVHRGLTILEDSIFTTSFIVPFSLDSGFGKVSGYLWDDECGGSMAKYVWITGNDTITQDTTGPQIDLFVNGKKITDSMQVKVDDNFTMSALLEDSSGIKLQSGRGIRLEIRGGNYYHLEDNFEYDIGSSTKGELVSNIELNTMNIIDSLTLIVRDNVDNESKIKFSVERTYGGKIVLENPVNYPNPVKGEKTRIEFYSSKDGMGTIKIFTISGRLIKTLTLQNVRSGTNSKYWDTRDEFHDKVGNGLYIYKIEVKGTGNESSKWSASCIGKMIVMR